MTEAALVRRICRLLDDTEDCWYVKYHGSRYGRAGIPDLLVCLDGVFLALEVKLPGKKTTKLQDRELDAIEHAGGFARVVQSVEDVHATIREAKGPIPRR